MRMIRQSIKVGGHVLLGTILFAALLQGCIEKGAVVVNCDQNEGGPGDGPRGCTPQGPYSASATGFRSMDGVSPVPAGANAMCSAAGSYKCLNEDQAGCSLLNPNKKCKSYYYYTAQNIANLANYCECRCAL